MREKKKLASTFLALFAIVILLTMGCTFVQTCTDGSSNCQSVLRGLRLRFLIMALLAVFITMGLCAYAGEEGSINCMALRPATTPGPIYLQYNQKTKLHLVQESLSQPVVGYQAFLSYDMQMLTLTSASYSDEPYSLHILDPITAISGTIDMAAGIDPASQQPTSQTALLAELEFASMNKEGVTSVLFRTAVRPSLFTDDRGNVVETCLINGPMIVIDNTPPEIGSVETITLGNDPGQCSANIMVRGPTAQDNLSGVDEVTGTRNDNEPLSSPYPVGTTIITWTAADRAGNTSHIEQSIEVHDTEPPLITAPADITVTADPLVNYADAANVHLGYPQVSDSCATPEVTNDAPARFMAGETNVTWTATDKGGNTAQAVQKVTVIDNRPIVVLREDDCRSTWKTPYAGLGGVSAFEYGKLKRIPIMWGVVTDWATTGLNGFSLKWSDLLNYLDAAGGELASHTVTHSAMPSVESYIDEIINGKSAIEANAPGRKCTTFLQCGYWIGDDNEAHLDRYSKLFNPVGQALQATYSQSMAYLGSGWRIGSVFYKYGMTNIYSIDYPSSQSAPAVLSTLDVAASTPGLLFCISCHGVQEAGGTGILEARADVVKALFDKLADLRDSGKIRLMNLNDAYNAQFSPDLNHIPDPGLEVCSPGPMNPLGPWSISGSVKLLSNGGINNSRYAQTTQQGSYVKCSPLALNPGRYELSWYQRLENGSLSNPLLVGMFYNVPYKPDSFAGINNLASTNTAPNVWERRVAYITVPVGYPVASLYFMSDSSATHGVDNVCLVDAPLDSAESPTESRQESITPSNYTLSWKTPSNDSVSSIVICYGTRTHPLSPSEGRPVATIAAVAGDRQSVTTNIDWSHQDKLFFSIFAKNRDGSYSPPDLVSSGVDRTPPSVQEVLADLHGDTLEVSWNGNDPDTAVYKYRYAVGTSQGGSNIVHWTDTDCSELTLSGMPMGVSLYLSVKAGNPFGYWSDTITVKAIVIDDLALQLDAPDGAKVMVSGVVTAVFSDCAYLYKKDQMRGIKLTGSIGGLKEGQNVTVSGTLATTNGERKIIVK